MKNIALLLVLFFSISASHACLNYYYSLDNKGHFHEAEDLRRAFNTNFNTKLLEKRIKKQEAKLRLSKDYKDLSDYAVLLLKAGQTEIALDILEQLSFEHPNDYQIAANLGTAYELSGNNEKALEFIKRGIQLNPDSHGGSEWVHVKLLEAKLKMSEDEPYLANQSVLDLTAEQKKDPKVRDQLLIQIRERFPFCKGPDLIMASLLIDLGDCYANTSSIEFAKASYEIAHHYYGASEEITDLKLDEVKKLLRQYTNLEVDRVALRREDDHGTHIRMSGIQYKKMLDDNNPNRYAVDWEDIETRPDSLLAIAEIERFVPPTPVEADTLSIQQEQEPQIDTKEETDSTWLYVLIACLGLGAGFAFFFLKRKR